MDGATWSLKTPHWVNHNHPPTSDFPPGKWVQCPEGGTTQGLGISETLVPRSVALLIFSYRLVFALTVMTHNMPEDAAGGSHPSTEEAAGQAGARDRQGATERPGPQYTASTTTGL